MTMLRRVCAGLRPLLSLLFPPLLLRDRSVHGEEFSTRCSPSSRAPARWTADGQGALRDCQAGYHLYRDKFRSRPTRKAPRWAPRYSAGKIVTTSSARSRSTAVGTTIRLPVVRNSSGPAAADAAAHRGRVALTAASATCRRRKRSTSPCPTCRRRWSVCRQRATRRLVPLSATNGRHRATAQERQLLGRHRQLLRFRPAACSRHACCR